jgi:pyrimidine-nucleoside phosphorylase/thymidine phosphorylase
MSFVDTIARKRDGGTLSQTDIDRFVFGLTSGEIPDYQASALLMAITLRGMNDEETAWLTDAMVRSGDRVDLSDIPGVKVGKHSTGGVGDKVSVVLAPLAAACGVIVPKMSGRGLGHTGGTLDKLQSIPGFRVDLTVDEFKQVLRAVGTSIIGQTASLAPADKRLYALRDVTGTIESIPLIAASIMSKKLAEGSNALVLDVKCGDGAFVRDLTAARALAVAMVGIGARAGMRTEAFVTGMDAPLGDAVGNALEIAECIAALKGGGPADLGALVTRLAARMLILGGVTNDVGDAAARVERMLASGRAVEVFARMIERQGGDPRVVDDPERLPHVATRATYAAPRDGYVQTVRAGMIGRACHALGAGRAVVSAAIDPAVGVVMRTRPGDPVRAGQPLLELHHRSGHGLEEALSLCAEAVVLSEAAPPPLGPTVIEEVR